MLLLPPDLSSQAAQRHGLFTRPDATRAGLSAKRLRSLVRSGIIDDLAAEVFGIAGSPETPKRRVMTACLEVGGVATATTACALRNLDGFSLEDPIEVLVADGRGPTRSALARIHRTRYLPSDHVVFVDNIPTLNVARTLFSLAALVPELRETKVSDAIEEAMRRGLAREPWLRWMLDVLRRPGRGGVAVFERALDRACRLPVTESWLETEFLRILERAGLPLPAVQVRIAPEGEFVARVDFGYPGTPCLIEANGHGTHSSAAQLSRDAARRRALTAAGFEVYDFTYDELLDDPELLLSTVRLIVDRAAAGHWARSPSRS